MAAIGALAAITAAFWQFVLPNFLNPPEQDPLQKPVVQKLLYIGRVINQKDGIPISRAKLSLDFQGVPLIAYSDSEGIYRFIVNTVGSSLDGRVRVEADGYPLYERFITLSPNNLNIEDIRLSERSEETLKAVQPPRETMEFTQPVGVGIVFDPPSNVRRSPNGDIICSVKTSTTIKIYGATGSWYSTDVCGERGVIHSSQVKF